MRKKSSPTKRRVGPKNSRRLCHHGDPVSSGWALTITPLLWRSFDSEVLSANAGISVRKRVVGLESLYVSGSLNEPWIAVPLDVICSTLPCRTCWRKNGLYGTRTRDGSLIAREPRKMFSSSSPIRNRIQFLPKAKRGGRGEVGEEPRCAGGVLES